MGVISNDDDLANRLRTAGITPTSQRLSVAMVLFSEDQHLTAEDLLALMISKDASISRATVYNTLNLFTKKGLVNELNIGKSRVIYDTNVASHQHIYNIDSGELIDVDSKNVQVISDVELPLGTHVIGADVVIRVSNPGSQEANSDQSSELNVCRISK